ncbi:MAG: methyltransferase domain-containing protein [Rubrimonas sp.]|uniref:methyltransferase domain-containing protein n=1 Tax=Rubrimonas sp. TaxID=2036015 RepID=UPI002FDE6463
MTTPDLEPLAALEAAYERGLAAERAGDRETAAAAFREVLSLDPEDRGGASVRLASLGCGPAPDRAPPAYVATLFDQNAELFDLMLVERLGYHAPLQLREMLEARGRTRLGRLLDLGCGTGLAGESLEDMAEHLTGVDLSEGMIAVAHEKEVYHDLYVGDAEGFLEGAEGERWDAIVATDVLPYLGEVAPLFALAGRRLNPGGLFAFSTESAPEAAFGDRGWVVGPHQRFAHAPGPLQAALEAAGFGGVEMLPIVVRHEQGAPVPGLMVLADRI